MTIYIDGIPEEFTGDITDYKGRNIHREDGPAVIMANGSQFWHQNHQLHRTDGPAVTFADGGQEWYQDGRRHRLDGPAVIRVDGTQKWWLNGQIHRLDGPAVIWANGGQDWWLYGVEYEEDTHPGNVFRKEHNLPLKYEDWPKEMKVLFEMMYKGQV
jgi:hypothetical protein